MDTQPSKRLRKEDFRIDWKNYPIEDENGNPITEDCTKQREEWLFEDCGCDAYRLADKDKCCRYYKFDYDPVKFQQWMQQHNYSEDLIAYWGLSQMFDDGWIKSPAFVDWRHFGNVLSNIGLYIFYRSKHTEDFIQEFNNPEDRVAILKHFIDNAKYIIREKDIRQYMLPVFKNLLSTHKEAARLHKEALKQQEKAEKAKNKTPKEKPEYILTLDEIINYVREENPDSAHVIRGMLRFFAMEKLGWSTTAVKKRIEQINQSTLVHQTNINAPVSQVVNNQHVDTLNTK